MQVLVNAEDVSLGVFEPGRFFGTEDADLVDGLEAGEVVVFEDHAAGGQGGHGCSGVGDFETDGGVLGVGAMRLLQECQKTAAELEEILAVSAGSEVPQAQNASVEIARAFGVDDREDGGCAGSAQLHGASVMAKHTSTLFAIGRYSSAVRRSARAIPHLTPYFAA